MRQKTHDKGLTISSRHDVNPQISPALPHPKSHPTILRDIGYIKLKTGLILQLRDQLTSNIKRNIKNVVQDAIDSKANPQGIFFGLQMDIRGISTHGPH